VYVYCISGGVDGFTLHEAHHLAVGATFVGLISSHHDCFTMLGTGSTKLPGQRLAGGGVVLLDLPRVLPKQPNTGPR